MNMNENTRKFPHQHVNTKRTSGIIFASSYISDRGMKCMLHPKIKGERH